MTPVEVPAELVEAALATQVEPGLPILPEDAGTALNYIRDDLRRALAAALPLYRATVLEEAALAFDIDDLVSGLFMAPGMSVPAGGFRTNQEAQRRVQDWLQRQARLTTTPAEGNPS